MTSCTLTQIKGPGLRATKARDRRALIDALKLEISMIREGRYNPPAGHPTTGRSDIIPRLLRDSVTCPNVGLADDRREVSCDKCMLHRYMPEDHPHQEMACYDIPLNEQGDTLASLERIGDPDRTQVALLSWLYRTVANLERADNRMVA
jgi:hypothetical protein